MTLPPLLPPGTPVVLRQSVPPRPAGAVAVIVCPPLDAGEGYRVRFGNGSEATLAQGSFRVQHHEKARLPDAERDFTPYVQLRVVVGSRAFGLSTDTSDTDLRGFYLPRARDEWSLAGVPEQLEYGEECYWEAKKFVLLALKANPNILEVLHSSLVLNCTPLAQELLDIRHAFLSRLVHQTYGAYAMGQFKRLEADLRTSRQMRWKHAMHLLRLLRSGTRLLQTGELVLDVRPERERLLAVKRGEVAWAEVEAWRLELHAEFDKAAEGTSLPERPDYGFVEEWLIRARGESVE